MLLGPTPVLALTVAIVSLMPPQVTASPSSTAGHTEFPSVGTAGGVEDQNIVIQHESSMEAGSGRQFPGLPIPLQPFIDFYETYPDPASFYPLSGMSGTLAFVIFSVLMLLTNAGFLPINIQDKIHDYDDLESFSPTVDNFAPIRVTRRQGQDWQRAEQSSGGVSQCVSMVLCPLERALALQLLSRPARRVQTRSWTPRAPSTQRPSRRWANDAYGPGAFQTGDQYSRKSCRRYQDNCSVRWLKWIVNTLTGGGE